MNISKDSWHYKVYAASFNLTRGCELDWYLRQDWATPISLCPYFWRVVLSPLVFLLWKVLPSIFWRTGWQRFAWALILLLLPAWFNSTRGPYLKFLMELGWVLFKFLCIAIPTVSVIALYTYIKNEKITRETKYLVKAYVKAKKRKVCPLLKFN